MLRKNLIGNYLGPESNFLAHIDFWTFAGCLPWKAAIECKLPAFI